MKFDKELVYIEWKDACVANEAWEPVDTIEGKLADCISVGYVINETEEVVVVSGNIALGYGKENQIDTVGAICIPKSNIVSRSQLRKK